MASMNSAMPFVQCCEHTYMILFELEGISLLRQEDLVESLLEVVVDRPMHSMCDRHESRFPDVDRLYMWDDAIVWVWDGTHEQCYALGGDVWMVQIRSVSANS